MGEGTITNTAQYFQSSTAAGTAGLLTAVAGVIRVNSVLVANITGMNFTIEGGLTTGSVVGSNLTPDVFAGRVKVTGQLTAYFDGVTLRDLFVNETTFGIEAVLYSDLALSGTFISVAFPKCKANGATKSDGEQGLTMTIPFQALYNAEGHATTVNALQTTLMMQDSSA